MCIGSILLHSYNCKIVRFRSSSSKVYFFNDLVPWKSYFWQKSKTFIGLFTTLYTSMSSSSHYLLQSMELLENNVDSMYYK